MVMNQYEYMRLKLADLPKDVIQQYTFQENVTKEVYAYLEIIQGMYGIPQAIILAQKQL